MCAFCSKMKLDSSHSKRQSRMQRKKDNTSLPPSLFLHPPTHPPTYPPSYIPTHTQTQIWFVDVKYLYAIISNMLLGKYYTISKIQWIFQKCIQVGSNRASQVAQWVKNLPTNAGDGGLILGSGRISWSRKWQPIPVFLPGKSTDRGAWCTTVHGITKSWT